MQRVTWEDSASALREVHQKDLPIYPSLLISEIDMRWKDLSIDDYRIVPAKKSAKTGIGKKEYEHAPIYSSSIILTRPGQETEEIVGKKVGSAIASIMSFVMRCQVIEYSHPLYPFLQKKGNEYYLMGPGSMWVREWESIFSTRVIGRGLRRTGFGHHPTFQEEQNIIRDFGQLYTLLMNLDEETYNLIMGSMRLYQLAFLTARVSLDVAYSLLVAAIEAISSSVKVKVKVDYQLIDPEGILINAMDKIGLEKSLQNSIKGLIKKEKGLAKRFASFVVNNLPDTFWQGDYSMRAEMESLWEQSQSGENERDLSEVLPEPEKSRLVRHAKKRQEWLKDYKKKRPKKTFSFNFTNREWQLDYLRNHLARVLNYTYGYRSKLFHEGKSFPKLAFEESHVDWVPNVFEEDYRELMTNHYGHKWVYKQFPNGKIFRFCSCRKKKKIETLLNIYVFEKIVHDSILNYLKEF